jgi:hypothetical protein
MLGRLAHTGVQIKSAALAQMANQILRVLLENVMIQ